MANVSLSSLYWIVASVNPIPSYSLFFCAVERASRGIAFTEISASLFHLTPSKLLFFFLCHWRSDRFFMSEKRSLFISLAPARKFKVKEIQTREYTSIAFFHRFNFRRISVHSLMSPAFNIHTDVYRLCRVDASAIIGVAQFLSYRHQLILARARVFQNLNKTDISRVKRLRVTGS